MANPLMEMVGGAAAAPAVKSAPAAAPLSNMGMLKQAAQQLKKVMATIQVMKNPQQALMMAVQQDPQLGATLQMLGGKNPVDVAREECQKKGMDFDAIMKQIF